MLNVPIASFFDKKLNFCQIYCNLLTVFVKMQFAEVVTSNPFWGQQDR